MTSLSPEFDDAPATNDWFLRLERSLEKAGDYLNPILVKEARQSMKSMQFIITFGMVMLLAWIWTILIVFYLRSIHESSLPYVATGQYVLGGYLTILLIPMIIISPFMAFHSLASERHDGTLELLSITSLNSRQIITGKLGSAVLQMLIFYSALAPCMAFCYMLRGIDVFTIGLALGWIFLASLLFTTLALVLAAFARNNVMQILLSMVLLIALIVVLMFSIGGAWNWSMYGPQSPFHLPEFWFGNLCGASVVASFCVLFVVSAAATLSFESDNRSTSLRYVMMFQHMLIVGWTVYYWLYAGTQGTDEAGWVLTAGVAVCAGYWWFMGAMLTGEVGELSPRVRRELPTSLLGRLALTWFNPGSGTGYVFAVANVTAFACLAIALHWTETLSYLFPLPSVMVNHIGSPFTGATNQPEFSLFIIVLVLYLVSYLGFGRLLVILARRITFVPMPMAFVIQFVLLNVGWAAPYMLSLAFFRSPYADYSILQLPNWGWTLFYVADAASLGGFWASWSAIFILLAFIAGIIFLLNLGFAHHEIEQTREEAPERVLADDRELHPAPVTGPSDPWEHDEPKKGDENVS